MKNRCKASFVAGCLLFASLPSLPAGAEQSSLGFLIGSWLGTGSGTPGQGEGSFSFTPDLQNNVLVRRSHSEYPSTDDKPATVHDDLLIVYANESKAIYFDNEGHVINYQVSYDSDSKRVTFQSVDPPPSPGFRLTYEQTAADKLRVTFEISPTGKASDFQTYLSGEAERGKPTR